MISYQDDIYLFEATIVEATFSDDETVQLDEITIHPSTPMGQHEFVLSDGTNHRIVRLVLISPNQDWRRNQTYAWKLDNAWMSDNTSSSSFSWLHWNVESFIDSGIQVPQNNSIFFCDLIELHFSPIGGSGGYHHKDLPKTKISIRDFKIGANLLSLNDDGTNTTSEEIIPTYPNNTLCPTCVASDGVVYGTSMTNIPSASDWYGIYPCLPVQHSNLWFYRKVAAPLICLLVTLVCFWGERRRRLRLYEHLKSAEEDLTLDVVETEDSYQNVLA